LRYLFESLTDLESDEKNFITNGSGGMTMGNAPLLTFPWSH